MKIQILMSVYNGSRYIQTQLDSIVAQDIEDKTLLIRDDGSTDDTLRIVRKYCEQFPWISYYSGTNIGVQKSFLDLIHHADSDAEYFALADQDDEWLPEKLSRAVLCLQGMKLSPEIPQLYCSDKQIVDEDLNPLRVTVSRQVRKLSFGNALVQDICTGCTAVFNKSLLETIQKHPVSRTDHIIMHDWWLYLTASCFGKVFYDQNAYIRYRQHGKNTSGAMINRRALVRYRLRELKKPRGEIFRQTELFLESYSDLLNRGEFSQSRDLAKKLLKGKKGIIHRMSLIFDRRFFRQKHSDDIVFRGILLIGKL